MLVDCPTVDTIRAQAKFAHPAFEQPELVSLFGSLCCARCHPALIQ